ncbi:hypothetical protein [Streptomyces marianii]|uniref:Lipoprotein n=1 Tax=Streptomyces marianii TaxID=1817406 RepID=A0A5R9E466_9ACTN|nr:hypothetical protein [Streptomyces marianii]TLQ43054.1 hypothetical protein FEF34_07755 [Streptomyces marianii]
MKFDVFRISTSLATAALAVIASTACGAIKPAKPVQVPEAVHHSELVGRWDGGKECGSPLPVIRLRDDYTFTANGVPVEWDGPVPDAKVTRSSADGKWHAVNKDPGLSPYLVLRFEDRKDIKSLQFTLDHGRLQMDGSVEATGGDPYSYPCDYKRTSADPDFGR